MSDGQYKNIGSLQLRVVEECSELIFAICKAERFGWSSFHPNTPNTNNTFNVLHELNDVIILCEQLKTKIIGEI